VRLLVTGSRGQLGEALCRLLGDEAVGADLPELDITSPESVAALLDSSPFDAVVNCAAWTAVDAAEAAEEQALAVNGLGPDVLARACSERGLWMVQVSTDYVFGGDATSPYAEDAPTGPQSAYGRTKLAGEVAVQELLPYAHYLVRTAWLYGLTGSNFVRTMLRLEGERETVTVVDDQVGQPTFADDLAAQIIALLRARPRAGTFHGTNSGETTWFGFARDIFELSGADPKRVLPVDSATFGSATKRPAYSVLGHDAWAAAGLAPMRHWRDALADALPRMLAE
jgi:dTDP-4-dehydrorhamnose reductase